MRLLELADEFDALERALWEAEGELTPELEARLAGCDLAERDKVQGYASLRVNLKAEEKSLDDEIAVLQKKRATVRNAIQRLDERALEYAERRGVTELQGTTRRLCKTANGGQQPIELLVQPDKLPPAFQRVTVAADLEKVRAVLEQAAVTPGAPPFKFARFLPRGFHIRVR